MIGNVKHIIVIESLDSSDGINFTGETLYKDVIKRRIDLYKKDFKHQFYKVDSKNIFSEIIKYIQHSAAYMPGGIIIHFEMHGDDKLKGLILLNGELIAWEEICDLLRPINITTKNRLFITMGTCNGRYLYKGVNPYKKSPYSGYISASKKVYAEEIYSNFSLLFEKVIESGNIVGSYLELEKEKSNFYYKDSKKVFDVAFAETVKNSGLRKEILKDAIEKTKKATGENFTEKEAMIMFSKTFKDIYNKQLEAFDFSEDN